MPTVFTNHNNHLVTPTVFTNHNNHLVTPQNKLQKNHVFDFDSRSYERNTPQFSMESAE